MNLNELPPGLVALTGDEGSGKTRLLQQWATQVPTQVAWTDLALPGQDALTPPQVWQAWRPAWPAWDHECLDDLVEALDLSEHLHKQCHMLSRGTRRKVAVVGLLACGARVTCLDQAFAALDGPSTRALREFLTDMADHPTRTWVLADYEADPGLPWALVQRLPVPTK